MMPTLSRSRSGTITVINLDDLTIQAPLIPTRQFTTNGRDHEDYRVEGFLHGINVGHLTIARGVGFRDSHYFDLTKNPPIAKPFVYFQETEETFRGQGICGRMIVLANEFYRGRLGTNLYSSTHFVQAFRKSSKRVWQKLQEEGLAVFEPDLNTYTKKLKDRWFML